MCLHWGRLIWLHGWLDWNHHRNLHWFRNLRKAHGNERSQSSHLHKERNEQYEAGFDLIDASSSEAGQGVGLGVGCADDGRGIFELAAYGANCDLKALGSGCELETFAPS